MGDRFVVTGSGRCGTTWMSRALTAAGVPCGHEEVFGADPQVVWPDHLRADSSWLAATRLDQVDVPVILMVRHPLQVVRSLVEIGFFAGWDQDNPGHQALGDAFPNVYGHVSVQDRALQTWVSLTRAALARAELVVRLEQLDARLFGRILLWAGADPDVAGQVVAGTPVCNHHDESRERTGVTYEPDWYLHSLVLRRQARELAVTLGYADQGG